jgi:hypothetical protein
MIHLRILKDFPLKKIKQLSDGDFLTFLNGLFLGNQVAMSEFCLKQGQKLPNRAMVIYLKSWIRLEVAVQFRLSRFDWAFQLFLVI